MNINQMNIPVVVTNYNIPVLHLGYNQMNISVPTSVYNQIPVPVYNQMNVPYNQMNVPVAAPVYNRMNVPVAAPVYMNVPVTFPVVNNQMNVPVPINHYQMNVPDPVPINHQMNVPNPVPVNHQMNDPDPVPVNPVPINHHHMNVPDHVPVNNEMDVRVPVPVPVNNQMNVPVPIPVIPALNVCNSKCFTDNLSDAMMLLYNHTEIKLRALEMAIPKAIKIAETLEATGFAAKTEVWKYKVLSEDNPADFNLLRDKIQIRLRRIAQHTEE